MFYAQSTGTVISGRYLLRQARGLSKDYCSVNKVRARVCFSKQWSDALARSVQFKAWVWTHVTDVVCSAVTDVVCSAFQSGRSYLINARLLESRARGCGFKFAATSKSSSPPPPPPRVPPPPPPPPSQPATPSCPLPVIRSPAHTAIP